MHLTTRMLERRGAFCHQLALFHKYFPHGGCVTPERCLPVARDFNWFWAAYNLLPNRVYARFLEGVECIFDEYRSDLRVRDSGLATSNYNQRLAVLFGTLAQRVSRPRRPYL